MIAVSTLLKSCAMPPASWPIACIFWLCDEILLQRALLGGVEREDGRARAFVAVGIGGRRDEEPRRARRLAPSSATSTGAMSPLPAPPRRSLRARRRGRARRRRRRSTAALRPASASAPPARGARRRRWRRSTRAVGVDRSDRHRRRVEEAREAHLRGAQVLGLGSSPGARLMHQRARGAGRAVAGEGDAVQDARPAEAAAAALEVDVELLASSLRPAGRRRWLISAAPSPATMSASLSPPDAELGEIIVEPAGERRVHIGDRAVGLGGKKAGRRVVEIVDRVLQILEERSRGARGRG